MLALVTAERPLSVAPDAVRLALDRSQSVKVVLTALIGNSGSGELRMMLQGWRWYGPNDPVSLDDIRQAGATDVVTALHQVPIGEAWTRAAVEERKNLIENGQPGRSPLTWSVVESIPMPDDVKRLGGKATRSIEAWIASLEAVAASGIKIICYNFMPVVDWCRTDLEWELPNGATAMRFDQERFAAFDLHILKRPERAGGIFRGRAGVAPSEVYSTDDARPISTTSSRRSPARCRARPPIR